MAATSVYVPRGSPTSLLPLWEALQDQQVGLTQIPFKWLLLHRDLEYVKFCMCPLSYLPEPSGSAIYKFCWPAKPGVLGAHLPSAGTPGWGAPCGVWNSCSLERTSVVVVILPVVGHLPQGYGSWVYYISTPPTHLIVIFFLTYLFLAALGLHCCVRAFSTWSEWGLLFVVVCGLLIAVASLVAEHRL